MSLSKRIAIMINRQYSSSWSIGSNSFIIRLSVRYNAIEQVSFLYCDHDAKFNGIAKENIVVNQKSGKVRTAFFPLDSLEAISEDERIKRIIPSHYLRLKMDVATSKVNVPTFRSNKNLTGNGVIIGIVDTGIDPNHPAHNIWDQTLPGAGVAEGGYGVELTGSMLAISRDTVGHGTHVAGIAGV